jgi:hypothetical protein
MQKNFAVQFAVQRLNQPNVFGLTVDRLFLLTIIVASGKSFTTVSVVALGGHGAAIVPLLS